MNEIDQNNIQLYPHEARAAHDRLEAALTGRDATVDTALRLVPRKHAVFKGTLDGDPVVFRLALNDAAKALAQKEWNELSRAWAYMSEPPLTVSKPLEFGPDVGLTVTSFALGKGLLHHLWSLESPARIAPMNLAADWLHKFTENSIEAREPNRRPWRNWAEAAVAKQPHEVLQKIEGRVFQKMKKLYRQINLPEWRVALAHGDFHLNNLHFDGRTVTGIDLGATNHAPLYKDIARALVHMSRRGMLPSGARRFGVDAAAFNYYVEKFTLSEQEINGFLPYFICFETLIKVEHPDMPKQRIEHAVAMSEALFADMKQIT
ncbi:phosphotransferase [Lentibacter algarum]|uniref:phosphotransferase n=1 Tax=Lentibacter algarum TaxID=576131 RepID=UPI001C077075|nr:phosphotransferase [Lentibacter algarum]MBU2981101.1 phosphotransferase [Lentibacter algarum]